MSLARLVDGPQAQLIVLPLHQVGVGFARLNRTGSSFGGQEMASRVWILPPLQVCHYPHENHEKTFVCFVFSTDCLSV